MATLPTSKVTEAWAIATLEVANVAPARAKAIAADTINFFMELFPFVFDRSLPRGRKGARRSATPVPLPKTLQNGPPTTPATIFLLIRSLVRSVTAIALGLPDFIVPQAHAADDEIGRAHV